MTVKRTAHRMLGVLPVVAVALLLPCSARAQAMVCKPNYDYSVEVDGSFPKNATLYQSTTPGMYFIDVPTCKTGLLMDMKARKVAPFPPDIRSRIQAVVDSHSAVPRPEGIGRKVAMPSG